MADKRRIRLSDQIRRAVAASGLTRYRISKITGIDQAVLSRFMAGKVGLSMSALDRLADALELEVVVRKQRKTKGR